MKNEVTDLELVSFLLFVSMLCVLHQSGHGHSHGGLSHSKKKKEESDGSNESSASSDDREKPKKRKTLRDNINVTAASIHVIGDFLQTIGVLITSYIVWFRVSYGHCGGF